MFLVLQVEASTCNKPPAAVSTFCSTLPSPSAAKETVASSAAAATSSNTATTAVKSVQSAATNVTSNVHIAKAKISRATVVVLQNVIRNSSSPAAVITNEQTKSLILSQSGTSSDGSRAPPASATFSFPQSCRMLSSNIASYVPSQTLPRGRSLPKKPIESPPKAAKVAPNNREPNRLSTSHDVDSNVAAAQSLPPNAIPVREQDYMKISTPGMATLEKTENVKKTNAHRIVELSGGSFVHKLSTQSAVSDPIQNRIQQMVKELHCINVACEQLRRTNNVTRNDQKKKLIQDQQPTSSSKIPFAGTDARTSIASESQSTSAKTPSTVKS